MKARHGNRQKYESRNPVQRALIAAFQRRAIDLAKSVRPRTVLEVGCGEGYALEALIRGGLDAALTGVDLSERAIREAEARLDGRAALEVADARKLGADGRTFDLVVMLEVLEHIEAPERMLPVLEGLTNRHLLLSVPWEPFFMGLNLLRGKNVRAWGNDPEHVNHWSREGFLRFVGSRFRVLRAPPAFPWTMALAERR